LESSLKDVQILQDKLLKELCSRDYSSKRLGKVPIFDIDDIYKKSFTNVEKQYFLKFLNGLPKNLDMFDFFLKIKLALHFLAEIIVSFQTNTDKQ